MSNERSFASDDENDSLLFERWEAHVIEEHPNPERIGCPLHEVLKSFVDRPASVNLAELNDTHITRCRECILELKELRRLREQKLENAASPRHLEFWMGWRPATAVLSVALVAALLVWQHYGHQLQPAPASDEVVALSIDLSADGVTRSLGADTDASPFTLPRRIVDLDLALPYFSPAGSYDFMIVKERNGQALETGRMSALADGPRTQTRLRLDLRRFPPGRYYLGMKKSGESTADFYPFTLH